MADQVVTLTHNNSLLLVLWPNDGDISKDLILKTGLLVRAFLPLKSPNMMKYSN